MLRSDVLPAPFGPMIEAICPALHRDRDVLDRAHAAKALRGVVDDELNIVGHARGTVGGSTSHKVSNSSRIGACALVMAGMMMSGVR